MIHAKDGILKGSKSCLQHSQPENKKTTLKAGLQGDPYECVRVQKHRLASFNTKLVFPEYLNGRHLFSVTTDS
jgi:hypothetical protein